MILYWMGNRTVSVGIGQFVMILFMYVVLSNCDGFCNIVGPSFQTIPVSNQECSQCRGIVPRVGFSQNVVAWEFSY